MDTIEGLSFAVNASLETLGYPYRYDKKETVKLVGGGVDALIHKALQKDDNEESFREFKKILMPNYKEFQKEHTFEYPGLIDVLKRLKGEGVDIFVCTNKPHEFAMPLIEKFFGVGFFVEAMGKMEGNNPKPDPYIVNHFIDEYHLDKPRTLFVGDSKTDYLTAKNSSLPVCICLWGYADYNGDFVKNADFTIKTPADLERIVL